MNVASLELCKELYKLSGWDNYHYHPDRRIPAYDLGYLLRKLPEDIKQDGVAHYHLRIEAPSDLTPMWAARVNEYDALADNPEDAACKLAIELFKQGVLQKDAA